MKRFLILMIAMLFAGSAFAETIDWTQYSDEELVAMRSAINAELASRTAPPEASPLDDFVIVTNGSEARVRSYTGSAADVVIPSEYEGCPVTSIGDETFRGNMTLVSVYIPGCVREVGDSAFYKCGSLTTVVFGDSTGELSLGKTSFLGLKSLKTLQFSRTRYTSLNIGWRALESVGHQGVLVINAGSLSVPQSTMAYMKSMTGLILLCDRIALGERALDGCTATEFVYMPEDAVLTLTRPINSDAGHLRAMTGCTVMMFPDQVSGIIEETFNRTPNMTIYCSEDSNAIGPCRKLFMPINTKDYQQKADELLQIAADMGYVW